jgi:hypothetical protein
MTKATPATASAHLSLWPCEQGSFVAASEEGHSHLVQHPQSPIQDLPDQERDVEMSRLCPAK